MYLCLWLCVPNFAKTKQKNDTKQKQNEKKKQKTILLWKGVIFRGL